MAAVKTWQPKGSLGATGPLLVLYEISVAAVWLFGRETFGGFAKKQ